MIGSKDFLGLIKIVIQSIFGQTFFCLHLCLVRNIFLSGKDYWPKRIFGQKKILVQKVSNPK